ncbi:MAG: DM13 domain-containing protein, partial [Thermoproteota archaeon]|nr:DM13 domain-containing protein [Thermoproteota archaeon]
MNKKAIIIVIIIAAIAIPVGIYTASPLFINTTVNEPLPTTSSSVTDLQKFQEFMSMNNEQERVEKGQQMATEEKNAILRGAAQTNDNTINENMTEAVATTSGNTSLAIGEFVGVNDGIHNAEGMAKVIPLDDGSMILRLENFKATNGPDLYVYLATDNSAS